MEIIYKKLFAFFKAFSILLLENWHSILHYYYLHCKL